MFTEKEVWKDVVGYEGLYIVSNLGRVMTLGNGKTKKDIMFMAQNKDGGGYLMVHLHKNGISRTPKVHRLVAEAFLPNPDNLPCINHKDEDKTNNFVWVNDDGTVDLEKSNLEWCTAKYNSNYGTAKSRWGAKNTNGKLSKPVSQYSLDGSYIGTYPSAAEAARQSFSCFNRQFHRGNISKCVRGDIPTAYGYVWKLKEKSG